MLVRKIVGYKLLYGNAMSDLEKKVNYYIEVGWEPFGSLAKEPTGSGYYQPVVLYEYEHV